VKIEPELIEQLIAAQTAYETAKEAVSARIVELSPFKVGDVLQEVNTGALYRVDKGSSGYMCKRNPRLFLIVTRVYQTKRRPARATTSISWPNSSYELYTGEWTK
jgi:hypothetical protein